MKLLLVLSFIYLIGCQSRTNRLASEQQAATPVDTLQFKQPSTHDYSTLHGVYDHESTTQGFAAVATIRQNGLDLYFTVSVAQGSCKGEAEGIVVMMEHTENFYIGFYYSENCQLQFTFQIRDKKLDIKEVALCSTHGSACNFEGTYILRQQ